MRANRVTEITATMTTTAHSGTVPTGMRAWRR